MIPVISVIIIVTISLLVTKIASAALVNTGLSSSVAKFQARSAFTGVGYTTSEAEQIARHPVRRKIISTLMLMGNAGIVTVMASLLLTFIHHDEKSFPGGYSLLILVGAIVILAFVASSKRIDAVLTRVIEKMLGRFTNLRNRDYGSLYKLSDDFHIIDLQVMEGDWVEGKTLKECELRQEGISVLGIEKTDGTYLGVPGSEQVIGKDDVLILYGKESVIKKLDVRKKGLNGDKDHQHAVSLYENVMNPIKGQEPAQKS